MDDRVRGGSSRSYLDYFNNSTNVRFYGHLDTKTLGGAGFASQATKGPKVWDFSHYDGIQLAILKADDYMYTFILKDELPDSQREDGREMSSISWEYDFRVSTTDASVTKPEKVTIAWDQFKATYRGRERKDVGPIKTSKVLRLSIMMRRQESCFRGVCVWLLTDDSASLSNKMVISSLFWTRFRQSSYDCTSQLFPVLRKWCFGIC